MSVAYLDTHVVLWLHHGQLKKLTKEARREIERSSLLISPMAYLELSYLSQRQRSDAAPADILAHLCGAIGLTMCSLPFASVAVCAIDIGWTDEPFDRLIVANAKANRNAWLITADETIRQHYPQAVW